MLLSPLLWCLFLLFSCLFWSLLPFHFFHQDTFLNWFFLSFPFFWFVFCSVFRFLVSVSLFLRSFFGYFALGLLLFCWLLWLRFFSQASLCSSGSSSASYFCCFLMLQLFVALYRFAIFFFLLSFLSILIVAVFVEFLLLLFLCLSLRFAARFSFFACGCYFHYFYLLLVLEFPFTTWGGTRFGVHFRGFPNQGFAIFAHFLFGPLLRMGPVVLVAPSTGWMLYYLCFSPSTAIWPPLR